MVNATTNTAPLTVTPTSVRYSLHVDSVAGRISGRMDLQRSQKQEDGTWLDDPRGTARKSDAESGSLLRWGLIALMGHWFIRAPWGGWSL
jgi:hypothetical protein